jgi:hypothetical protein
MLVARIALVAVVVVVAGRAARAEVETQPREQGSFHLHLELGAGSFRSATYDGIPEYRASHLAGASAATLGLALNERWVWGVEVFGLVAPNARMEGGGSSRRTTLALVGVGPTVHNYISPTRLNILLAFTPAVTWLSSSGGVSGTSGPGWGFRMAVGKEWQNKSSRWSYGVVGQLFLSANRLKDRSFKTGGGTLNLSLSLN